MDRCALAYQYHKQGYNCAQSVAGAFADMTGMEPERLFAAPEDLAAAEAAATLFPHTRGEDREAKRKIYSLAKQFRQRFFETFGNTRCGDLLRTRPGVSEQTSAAQRMELTAHCDIMIVTAVEILEALLAKSAD